MYLLALFQPLSWTGRTLLALIILPLIFVNTTEAGINEAFTVKVQGLGSCDQNRQIILERAFNEAIEMAKVAVAALSEVENGKFNWFGGQSLKTSEYLRVLFGITPSGLFKKITPTEAERLRNVKGVYQKMIDLGNGRRAGPKPVLFCNDDWQKWEQQADGKYRLVAPEYNNVDLGATSDTLQDEKTCRKYTGAFNSYQTFNQGLRAITWCPSAFTGFPASPTSPNDPHRYLQTLNNVKVTKHEHIDTYDSIPGQFVHEMAHLLGWGDPAQPIGDRDVTPEGQPEQKAYMWYNCHLLVHVQNGEWTMRNADSYHQFALAIYLKEYDWASGFADGEATINQPTTADQMSTQAHTPDTINEAVSETFSNDNKLIDADPYVFLDMKLAKQASVEIVKELATLTETPPKESGKPGLGKSIHDDRFDQQIVAPQDL